MYIYIYKKKITAASCDLKSSPFARFVNQSAKAASRPAVFQLCQLRLLVCSLLYLHRFGLSSLQSIAIAADYPLAFWLMVALMFPVSLPMEIVNT